MVKGRGRLQLLAPEMKWDILFRNCGPAGVGNIHHQPAESVSATNVTHKTKSTTNRGRDAVLGFDTPVPHFVSEVLHLVLGAGRK